jgi:hypothetical protein
MRREKYGSKGDRLSVTSSRMREKQNDTKYRIMSKEAKSCRIAWNDIKTVDRQTDTQTLWVTVPTSLCFSIRPVNLFCFVSEKRQLKINCYVIKRYKLPIIIPLYGGHVSRLRVPLGSEFVYGCNMWIKCWGTEVFQKTTVMCASILRHPSLCRLYS